MNSFNSVTLALVFIDHRERQDAEYRSRTDRERTDHISRRTRDLEGEERKWQVGARGESLPLAAFGKSVAALEAALKK